MDPSADYATRELRISQFKCLQFLREEFDAAYDARRFGVKLACLDNMLRGVPAIGYIGARDENPQYPIDQAGGPQQILRRIVTPNALGSDLCAKVSCSIVLRVLEYHKAGYFTDPNGAEGLPCELEGDCFDCRRNSVKINRLQSEHLQSLIDADRILKVCLGIGINQLG